MEVKDILKKLNFLKFKDLKKATIIRGIDFWLMHELDALGIQTWLIQHWEDPIDKGRLRVYDEWIANTLKDEGTLEGEFPEGLKLAKTGISRDYLPDSLKESPDAILNFRPREGTPKERVYELVGFGYSPKEIITYFKDTYPGISEGSIKVWASKAKKQKVLKDERTNS